MVSTRSTTFPKSGPSGQHRDAPDATRAIEAVRAQAELLEKENHLARAAQEARKIEVESLAGSDRPSWAQRSRLR
ncbi:hypothetical protein E4U19_005967 [Claviceps sp. Clav32 group G5]|nr:hypothetical protein E4U40_006160 [Claviceps sp. LM458 group G5]KAG6021109.1 hypothetical protein E4U19_005967 [Claviceps sp. Clav32 group G5]